jgi:hypothetical protein
MHGQITTASVPDLLARVGFGVVVLVPHGDQVVARTCAQRHAHQLGLLEQLADAREQLAGEGAQVRAQVRSR